MMNFTHLIFGLKNMANVLFCPHSRLHKNVQNLIFLLVIFIKIYDLWHIYLGDDSYNYILKK